jgi:anti-anti-sigma factor
VIPPKPPTVEVRWPSPGVGVVELGGEHDLASAPGLERDLETCAASCSHLVIDLSAVSFVDSSIIGVLLEARTAAERDGRRFNVVLGHPSAVERTLEVAQVLDALNVVATVDDALR